MRILVQRTAKASVKVDREIVGQISNGLLLYVCLEEGDSQEQLREAARKISLLRLFEDESGKMNLNINQAGGKVLSVSQFTLSWDGSRGHRPSFDKSMAPQQARLMYNLFNQILRELGVEVETGRFGADMQVESVNDGPVTFFLTF